MDLTLAPKELPSITGNFELFKADLVAKIEGYKQMPLTEETVAPVKSAIVSIRTSLEKIENTAISAYFDTPKKELKAQFAELYGIIADGENKVNAIIAEDTRKRNDATTKRLTAYIKEKIKGLKLENDVVDYVDLKKSYYNKTAKETETLDDIDNQLLQFEKNFAAFNRAEKKINKMAEELGPVFNKARYIHNLSKYGEDNDTVSVSAEEEAERLREAANSTSERPAPAPVARRAEPETQNMLTITAEFPLVTKSKGSDDLMYTFTVPKELKKNFAELLKSLKDAGIKVKKL